ncbi:Uncharacterized protein CLAVI_000172 [Candidatus Clavichlamydia salmonicola]|uniref:EscJ/YscJ/HrcJ family type III secretion inner membrane ring protein n=1 Tax=Candidatus Clavichlamydia salmonicola TaxID=469812 RepID=UPI0018917248|nr:EscJ/YscJ/HrcJ family type III secretion inner membrane ring protein [Candidatus Clavichlamydia salmonicola]MBF5050561.1 Uncharacterized protein [Candidatus Clavichlamydia salmonicola]
MRLHRLCLLTLIGILTLFCTGCGKKSVIASGIPAREANEIVVLLISKGIAAEKTPAITSSVGGGGGEQLWNIIVDSPQITKALGILNQCGLPRIKGTSLLDLFAKQGLVPSELQEKVRYQEGLAEQLATTIRKMHGIVDSTVQVSFPQSEDSTATLTASVYIKHRGSLDNPQGLISSKVRRLVANAIPGLAIENVSIITDKEASTEMSLLSGPASQKELTCIWGLMLAKGSLVRFRLIFYFFSTSLFLIAAGLIWVSWKILPLVKEFGGLKTLLNPVPYGKPPTEKKPETPEAVVVEATVEPVVDPNTSSQEEGE